MDTTGPDNRIHVVEVLDATDGGTRTHLLQLLRGLDRARFRLTFIASAERNPRFRDDMKQLQSEGIEVIEASIVRQIAPRRDLRALQRLTAVLRELRPGVVHTHASKSGVLGRLAAARAGVPAVIHTPHTFYFQGKSGLAREFFRRVERAMLLHTTKLVLLTEGQECLAREELGAGPERTAVIPNGVDTARFAPRGRKGPARQALGLPPEAPVVGAITRFVPQKRCELFMEAMAQVVQQAPECRCLLVGDGPLRERAMAQARRLNLADRIVWRGHSDEPMEFYDAMDLLALSSQYEGLPYTLLEAMAAGVPVVAPRIIGCREVIEDGRTGALVAPDDPAALAAGIVRCLADPAWARTAGAAARAVVEQRYPLRLFLDRISSLYLAVMEPGA